MVHCVYMLFSFSSCRTLKPCAAFSTYSVLPVLLKYMMLHDCTVWEMMGEWKLARLFVLIVAPCNSKRLCVFNASCPNGWVEMGWSVPPHNLTNNVGVNVKGAQCEIG